MPHGTGSSGAAALLAFALAFAAAAAPRVALRLAVAGRRDRRISRSVEMQNSRCRISNSNTQPKFGQCRTSTHRFFTGTKLFIHDVHPSTFEYYNHPKSNLHRNYLPPLPPLLHHGLPLLFPLHDGATAAFPVLSRCSTVGATYATATPSPKRFSAIRRSTLSSAFFFSTILRIAEPQSRATTCPLTTLITTNLIRWGQKPGF
jgi:hypothetical protein